MPSGMSDRRSRSSSKMTRKLGRTIFRAFATEHSEPRIDSPSITATAMVSATQMATPLSRVTALRTCNPEYLRASSRLANTAGEQATHRTLEEGSAGDMGGVTCVMYIDVAQMSQTVTQLSSQLIRLFSDIGNGPGRRDSIRMVLARGFVPRLFRSRKERRTYLHQC